MTRRNSCAYGFRPLLTPRTTESRRSATPEHPRNAYQLRNSGLKKTRFLKVSGAAKELDQATIDRARQLAGLKGYVTNLSPQTMPGQGVISAYHDLWQVEASFRMTKSDLRARPVFHHRREAIEAHLTIVFAALAVTRYLTRETDRSIKKIVRTLRPLRSVIIGIDNHQITADPAITPDAREILNKLPPITTTGH